MQQYILEMLTDKALNSLQYQELNLFQAFAYVQLYPFLDTLEWKTIPTSNVGNKRNPFSLQSIYKHIFLKLSFVFSNDVLYFLYTCTCHQYNLLYCSHFYCSHYWIYCYNSTTNRLYLFCRCIIYLYVPPFIGSIQHRK